MRNSESSCSACASGRGAASGNARAHSIGFPGIRAGPGQPLGPGFSVAMIITAGVCLVGAFIAALTVRTGADFTHQVLPGINHACQDPCTRQPGSARGAA